MYENGKMRPVKTVLRTRGKGIKENDGGGVNLRYIVSTFVNITLYSQYNMLQYANKNIIKF
jgi:hypothetical protein